MAQVQKEEGINIHERVISVLRNRFVDLSDGLEDISGGHRVSGFVVSPSFVGVDDHSRQERLWQALEDELSGDELRQVGPIVAMTPAEASIPFDSDD